MTFSGFLVTLAATVSLAACVVPPTTYTAPAPRSAATYDCAVRKVGELGYTVTNTSRDAGSILADRPVQRSGFQVAMDPHEYTDRLTIAIFGDSASRTIRVTASRTQTNGLVTQTISTPQTGLDAANQVIASCGERPVASASI